MGGGINVIKNHKHIPYTIKDFTWEEVSTANPLAVAVLRDKRKICKLCGGECVKRKWRYM